MLLISITLILFIITYVAMWHRCVTTANLSYKKGKKMILLIIAGITYFLVLFFLLNSLLKIL